MPTLLRWKGYRFFFYSADRWEPPHIHAVKQQHEAKIWLTDVTIAVNLGFSARELSDVVVATREHREAFMEAWDDHFGA